MDAALIGIRFVHFTTAMLLFGASLFPFYASVRAPDVRWARASLAWLAVLSGIAWLMAEAVSMSGDAGGWSSTATIGRVLDHSEFGHIWRWHMGLLALLAVLASAPRPPWKLVCVTACLAVATLAGIGHGDMGEGSDNWLHLGNQTIHLLSASVWAGGLLALLQLITSRPERTVIRQALHRFSLAGMATVGLILATGLVNSWFLVGSIRALLHTDYGHVLTIKVSLFLAMAALALFNRLVLMPRIIRSNDDRPMTLLLRSVAIEQACALLAIAAVSVLGTMTPAFDMHGMPM